jgi:hypothetical protein
MRRAIILSNALTPSFQEMPVLICRPQRCSTTPAGVRGAKPLQTKPIANIQQVLICRPQHAAQPLGVFAVQNSCKQILALTHTRCSCAGHSTTAQAVGVFAVQLRCKQIHMLTYTRCSFAVHSTRHSLQGMPGAKLSSRQFKTLTYTPGAHL